jgi:hypothetical protein
MSLLRGNWVGGRVIKPSKLNVTGLNPEGANPGPVAIWVLIYDYFVLLGMVYSTCEMFMFYYVCQPLL